MHASWSKCISAGPASSTSPHVSWFRFMNLGQRTTAQQLDGHTRPPTGRPCADVVRQCVSAVTYLATSTTRTPLANGEAMKRPQPDQHTSLINSGAADASWN